MNIWISSDYHFNHDKEFIWKARGFESVEEMNETIVKKNNECVAPEDTLVICGDLMLGGADKLEEGIALLNRMNGRKLVVGGNMILLTAEKPILGLVFPCLTLMLSLTASIISMLLIILL